MRAIWFDTFGHAKSVLISGEWTKPSVNSGEVLVRLHTTAVNPSDVKKRAGAFPNLLDNGAVVPHSDGAGVIEGVSDGINANRIGERVWLYQAQHERRFGTAAEYISIDARRAVTLPENISFEVGACLGIPAMTAHRCVFADGDIAGQTVLVTGGGGRVGYYAIQWAKQAGARVIATASNEIDIATCQTVGADAVINHRQTDWGYQVLATNQSQKIDRVIDVEFGANLLEILKLIKTGGTIATYASTQVKTPHMPFLQMMYLDLTIRLVIVYAMPEAAKQSAAKDITTQLKTGGLQHRIARQMAFEEMVAAHECIEQGMVRGCVVVHI